MSLDALPTTDLWQELTRTPRPLLVWGMGDGADKLFARLGSLGITPAGVFASEGFVRGQSFRGYRVMHLSEAEATWPDFTVLVAFATRLPEVLAQVARVAERHPLLVPDMPVAGDAYFDLPFCRAHWAEIEQAGALWADETSRRTYESLLRARLSGSLSQLLCDCTPLSEAFGLLPLTGICSAVDAGAYVGDTARFFLERMPHLSRILALEPDPRTCRKLAAYAESEERAAVTVRPLAAWDREEDLPFAARAGRGAAVRPGVSATLVRAAPIDALLGDAPADLLKFDVEGAERRALLGAAETLRRCRPSVVLSLYHRAEDLFALPLLLRDLCPDYAFYLRRPACIPAWETALVAVPRERMHR